MESLDLFLVALILRLGGTFLFGDLAFSLDRVGGQIMMTIYSGYVDAHVSIEQSI